MKQEKEKIDFMAFGLVIKAVRKAMGKSTQPRQLDSLLDEVETY